MNVCYVVLLIKAKIIIEYCHTFVCKHCENYDFKENRCKKDFDPAKDCLNLISDRLNKHSLKRIERKDGLDWIEE